MTLDQGVGRSAPKPRLWDQLRLRPYGDRMLTPAVRVWLAFAWAIILLMATIEGLVWGLVGSTIVPQESAWLKPFIGTLLFAVIFGVVWVIDASLIMSERPVVRARRWDPGANQGLGALLRWLFGFIARLAIVALSLYVTAPFLGKLIRADDIEVYHQQQVERYFAERETQLKAQIAARTAQIDETYRARSEPIKGEIEQLSAGLVAERARRAAIESEYAPEIEVLRRDLAAAQAKVGDEILGRNGRPSGRGPEARKWEANAALLAEQLNAKQSERDARVSEIDRRIQEWEQRLAEQTERLQRLTQEYEQRVSAIADELKAQQPPPNPPRLTFAARSKILQAIQESPEEQSVPHFERVEGFSQALLGVLFLSLIALKLFEPTAVRAYFSETLQMQYCKYLEGGLDDIPGFAPPANPGQRLNPVEFARLWLAYEKDPAAFFAERQAIIEVREPLLRYLAERELERDRIALRRANLDDEFSFIRERRRCELVALERELKLRTDALQSQLALETRTLKDQRRVQLAIELQKARQDWNLRQLHEEEQLRLERERLAQEHERAMAELRLREQELFEAQARAESELQQAELAERLEHERKRFALQQEQQREERKARIQAVREEISRLLALEAKQRADYQTLREAERRLEDEAGMLRASIAVSEVELAELRQRIAALKTALVHQAVKTDESLEVRRSLWSRLAQTPDDARDIERELRGAEKAERSELEQLAKLKGALEGLERRLTAKSDERREAEQRLRDTLNRIQFHEDSLKTLLEPKGLLVED
ncbi:hypothetical protein GWK36_07505 [Caldichromatium japonicum]|uniref:Uncharacterized protein n=1 Tax=Caldichromatium japonicum TaxID=2699430 RepID=A0A6G7VDA5_9GAMM|nr:hypothetical protein [Caldichromatium japonicum]QIK37856.1 hypothetical protein GWK36_07505 [Caldichromatium japonicum]